MQDSGDEIVTVCKLIVQSLIESVFRDAEFPKGEDTKFENGVDIRIIMLNASSPFKNKSSHADMCQPIWYKPLGSSLSSRLVPNSILAECGVVSCHRDLLGR